MFEVKLKDALGRIGKLDTPHGKVETPLFIPVVNPNLMTVPIEKMVKMGMEMLITNAYIIHQKPALAQKAVEQGLHRMLAFDGPIMTDSGSYQLSVYGDMALTNREVTNFQIAIGSDVIVPKDIPTPPYANRKQTMEDLDITIAHVKEAREILDEQGAKNLLAAPVQGSTHPDLRERGAEGVREYGDVFPVGAVVPLAESYRFSPLVEAVLHAKMQLPTTAPVHLFGAGHQPPDRQQRPFASAVML